MSNDIVRGLINTGNTCFLNSVLQGLAALSPLHEWLRLLLVYEKLLAIQECSESEHQQQDKNSDQSTMIAAKFLSILRALSYPMRSSGALGLLAAGDIKGFLLGNSGNSSSSGAATSSSSSSSSPSSSSLFLPLPPLHPRLALGTLSSYFESTGGQQHDAQELLTAIVSSFDEQGLSRILRRVRLFTRKYRLSDLLVFSSSTGTHTNNNINTTTTSHHQSQRRKFARSRMLERINHGQSSSGANKGGQNNNWCSNNNAFRISSASAINSGGSSSLTNPFVNIIGRRTECLACTEATILASTVIFHKQQQQQLRSVSRSSSSLHSSSSSTPLEEEKTSSITLTPTTSSSSSSSSSNTPAPWQLSREGIITLAPPSTTNYYDDDTRRGGGGYGRISTTTSIESLLRSNFTGSPTSGFICDNPTCEHISYIRDRMGNKVGVRPHNALRWTLMMNSPPILVLHINRLQDGYKNNAHIRFDSVLDMTPYTLTGASMSMMANSQQQQQQHHQRSDGEHLGKKKKEHKKDNTPSNDGVVSSGGTKNEGNTVTPTSTTGRTLYDLMAVVVHLGGPYSGHYITHRRVPVPAMKGNTTSSSWQLSTKTPTSSSSSSVSPPSPPTSIMPLWCECSDATVRPCGGDALAKDSQAYLLFYVRRDIAHDPRYAVVVASREAVAANDSSSSRSNVSSSTNDDDDAGAGEDEDDSNINAFLLRTADQVWAEGEKSKDSNNAATKNSVCCWYPC